MQAKIIGFLVCLYCSLGLSAQSDRLRLELYNHGELQQEEMPFFDKEDTSLVFRLSNDESVSQSIILEIKKVSTQQHKLKPIVYRSYKLKGSLQDTIVFSKYAFYSGNFEMLIYTKKDSVKVLYGSRSFQLLSNQKPMIQTTIVQDDDDAEEKLINLENTFVNKYDISTLKRNVSALLPIAKTYEIKFIRQVELNNDLSVLKRFFFNFWADRNPSAPEAEWKFYAQQLNYVAKEYGSASAPGHETDRGRVYLAYGKPDLIEKRNHEQGALPYEVWVYQANEGRRASNFLFYQSGLMSKNMLLLHSTMDGELFNPEWESTLLADPTNSNNRLTYKVYEYFTNQR